MSQRRASWPSSLPKPPARGGTRYAKSRAELADLDEGKITRLVLDTEAWREVMVPVLDQLDARDVARRKPGPRRSYSALELESVLLFQRVCGLSSYRAARDRLAGDRHGETRRLLGFDLPRSRGTQVVRLTEGIPSEASISRHRKRFGETRRVASYEALFARLLDEHLEDPAMQEECRILDLDGSHVLTHYRCPIPNSRRPVRPEHITCPDGGFVPPSDSSPWRTHGHGFNLVSVTTSTGLPLVKSLVPVNESETTTANAMMAGDFATRIAPHLPSDGVAILSADAGLNSRPLRQVMRELGIVENIHLSSHADRVTSVRLASSRTQARIPIEGYPDWFANGHRELACRCGAGTVAKKLDRDSRGRLRIRSQGRCTSCGSISITAGLWRKTTGSNVRYVRCWVGEEHRADLTFGNPLTFNDPVASIFGAGRFGHQEGFHGQLQTRFGLLSHKGWYRRKAQASLDLTVTFCIIHTIAMEQRRRERITTAQAQAPPGQAAA